MYRIWSNEYDVIDQLAKDILEDPDGFFGIDKDNAFAVASEQNDDFLDDERANLNIDVGDEIIIIANLGLWDGNHMAYKTPHITNIADCFSGTRGDYVTWFVDSNGDLKCRDSHHDGTNIYLYRAWKDGISEEQKGNFLYKVYRGQATRKDITRYTRKIGTYVADVYGWDVRR